MTLSFGFGARPSCESGEKADSLACAYFNCQSEELLEPYRGVMVDFAKKFFADLEKAFATASSKPPKTIRDVSVLRELHRFPDYVERKIKEIFLKTFGITVCFQPSFCSAVLSYEKESERLLRELFGVEQLGCSSSAREPLYTQRPGDKAFVSFAIGGETVRIHKSILLKIPGYSPQGEEKFKSLFTNLNLRVFELFVEYLYTDKISRREKDLDWIIELGKLARTLSLLELEKKCSLHLLFCVNSENFPKIAMYAQLVENRELLFACIYKWRMSSPHLCRCALNIKRSETLPTERPDLRGGCDFSVVANSFPICLIDFVQNSIQNYYEGIIRDKVAELLRNDPRDQILAARPPSCHAWVGRKEMFYYVAIDFFPEFFNRTLGFDLIKHTGDIYTKCPLDSRQEKFLRSWIGMPFCSTSMDTLDLWLNEQRKRGEGTDIVFDVAGQKFPAHREVLSQFPYFKAMFGGCFRERKMEQIALRDISERAFEVLLTHLYTGEVWFSEQSVEYLLEIERAADMFIDEDLKKLSHLRLLDSVSPENLLQLMVYAEHTHDEQLLHACGWVFEDGGQLLPAETDLSSLFVEDLRALLVSIDKIHAFLEIKRGDDALQFEERLRKAIEMATGRDSAEQVQQGEALSTKRMKGSPL